MIGGTLIDGIDILMVIVICISSMLYEVLFLRIIDSFDVKNKKNNVLF